MENLVSPTFWSGKRVLITGHTGFKGSWLSLWLSQYSAKIAGFSLPLSRHNYLYGKLDRNHINQKEMFGDIRDIKSIKNFIIDFCPDIIFHLAAQPLVRRSYYEPAETFSTNILGILNILEVVKSERAKTVIVNVTSDKCYKNKTRNKPFQENESLGGNDPYSASKACSEIITAAYRSAFSENGNIFSVASARAGNVIGGGDMAEDRLVPDFLRALDSDTEINLRNPNAIRPWQFVLDPIAGYLQLAQALTERPKIFSDAWNFGPIEKPKKVSNVISVLMELSRKLPLSEETKAQLKEESFLLLDSSKARTKLGWQSKLDLKTSLEWTLNWHLKSLETTDMTQYSSHQIERYEEIA